MSSIDFSDLNPAEDDYASNVVDRLLAQAIDSRASDLHLTQSGTHIDLRWRIDGRLCELGRVADGESAKVLARLKALARLVTYRSDIPQDGRIRLKRETGPSEVRVSTLPILNGERAVVRLALRQHAQWTVNDLGLPGPDQDRVLRSVQARSGVIVISGPAGAGKTTTAYACLRQMLSEPHPRSVVTLEDPVECQIEGTAQAQVEGSAEFNWSNGLKALLRQDPEVMLVGEVRDSDTAKTVFQAAMTGQLVVTTLHARTCADALRRLLDFDVLPQHLMASLNLLTCQRLIPALCECRDQSSSDATEAPDSLCPLCKGFGTRGRTMIAEFLPRIEGDLAERLITRAGADMLHMAALSQGMQSLTEVGEALIKTGRASSQDVKRAI